MRFPVDALPGQLGAITTFVARACNRVNLCSLSTSSAELITDQRPPSGGQVFLVSSDGASEGFMKDSILSVSWTGFSAPGRGVSSALQYELCVGTSPYGCQLSSYTPVGGDGNWKSDSLILPCSVDIYATVRATTCNGLHVTVASDASKHCCEAPVAGTVTVVDAAGDALTFVGVGNVAHTNVSWVDFADACSRVREYALFIRLLDGTELWNMSFDEVTSQAQLPSPHSLPGWLDCDGCIYNIAVTATSHAGSRSTASTNVTVDTTAPIPTAVQLRTADSPSLAYARHSVRSTMHVSCISHGTNYVDVFWALWATSASELTSYEVALVPAMYLLNGSSTDELMWIPTALSGLATFATNAMFRDARDVGISVRGCNSVGLCAVSDWHLAHLINEPPGLSGQVIVLRTAKASNNFLGGEGTQGIAIEWDEFYSGVQPSELELAADSTPMSSTVQYEVCLGTLPQACQLRKFSPVNFVNTWEFSGLDVPCGATIFANVRATNCAGLQVTVASNGSKLCCEAPIVGTASLANSAGELLSFVSSADITIIWSGFSDSCSGVREYLVMLCMLGREQHPLWNITVDANVKRVRLPVQTLQQLAHGSTCSLLVTATSHSGLSSTAMSSFTVDRTPPVVGAVYNGLKYNVTCQPIGQPFHVSWELLEDTESGVHAIEWSLGTHAFAQDLLPNRRVEDSTRLRTFVDTKHLIRPGMIIHSTLTVTNGARQKSVFTAPPVRMTAESCQQSFLCLPPAQGVHPLMLPLVLGLIYHINGQIR